MESFMKAIQTSSLALLAALSAPLWADVQSLTSAELIETYIEDSTIIVTPAQREKVNEARRVITYTIDPANPVKNPADEQAELVNPEMSRQLTLESAAESARQLLQGQYALSPREPFEVPQIHNRELNLPNVPPIQLPRAP